MFVVRFILRVAFQWAFRAQDRALRRAVKRRHTQGQHKAKSEKYIAVHERLRAELEARQARAL